MGIERPLAQAGIGAAIGALSKHAMTSGPMAGQVGSTIGATLATGGTVTAALAAGAVPVTAAVAAGTAAAVAAAPFVLGAAAIGGVIWGISKLLED